MPEVFVFEGSELAFCKSKIRDLASVAEEKPIRRLN